jgi:chaperone required for assembly of F1-ATPase
MSQNPKASMKRFYKDADFERVENGLQIRLDARPVRTPNRVPLVVESERLAWAIVAEWLAQGQGEEDEIDPASMPMTGLANAAIDRVGPERAVFITDIANYAGSDLLCYRAEGPEPLVARQAAAWDGMLAWAEARYGAAFVLAAGVMPVAQPERSLAVLREAVAAMSAWQLAAMARIVNLSGTLVGALALHEGEVDADALWAASILDERWQAELWGEDHWADKHREDRERDFRNAVGFLGLVG